jgi:pyridoxamine 5'-phosphate oxidase
MKSINEKLAGLRIDYRSIDQPDDDYPADPLNKFEKWMASAIDAGAAIPNAMHLSTVGSDGRPSGRIVLLHGLDERGFIFYSDYQSRKGNDLNQNRFASVTFFWSELFRQVRVEGEVFRLPGSESENYFRSRPRESQISALASEQSKIMESRELLEKRVFELEQKYKDQDVPRPAGWGGYYLSPYRIEFWQGKPARLHDRILYTLIDRSWKIQRLFP